MSKEYAGQNTLTYLVTLIKTALRDKVDKADGKGLSTNDFTTEEKNKLAGIASGATAVTVADSLASTSKTDALSANQGKVLDEKIKALSDGMSDLGYGDMLKSAYDTNGDGVVDNAEKLGGQTPDYYAKATDVPAAVSQLTNDSGFQTAGQVESAINGKGYQTSEQVDAKINAAVSSVYKPCGSVAFDALPELGVSVLGNVYNITNAFITTADFTEGSGAKYPAGTNVAVVEAAGTYKYDALSGAVDLSGYVQESELAEINNDEVSQIWNSITV